MAALTLAGGALGQESSELEERALARVLGLGDQRDPAPAGKLIESVQVARLPVFDEDDPVPDFVNALHAQTRERVIRRELLLTPGDEYSAERAQETVRNLQLLPQFGVVVVAALRGSTEQRVRVVVIVRDVWSLRLAYDFQGTFERGVRLPFASGVALPLPKPSVNYLLVNPVETNLFGTRTQAGGIFTLQPDRYSVGANALHPRFAGTKVDASAQGRVFVNLDSGKAEGSTASFAVYRNLVALSDRWAFLGGAGWLVEQTRVFSDRQPFITRSGVPLEYRTSIQRGGGEVTRSFGRVLKFDVSTGFEVNRRSFEARQRPEDSDAAFAQFVARDVPVSDTRLSPFLQLEHRSARFLATRDVETLALQESFALGQTAALRVYPAARGLGSSRDLVGGVAWLGYTLPWQDGFVRGVGSSAVEVANDAKHQASGQGALRVVTPRLGFLRLVADGAMATVYRNYLNRRLVLGGDTRPRGYPSASLRGSSAFAATLEARTRSVNALSARVGLALFYDVGGVEESLAELRLKQSVGVGVRVLFPQLNRQVFRLDWAAPLSAPDGFRSAQPLPGGVYFTFGQAFDMPRTKLPEVLGAETTLLEVAQ